MHASLHSPSIFLDADTLVAGAASTTGAARLILRLGEAGLLDLVSSAQAKREADSAIRRKLPDAMAAFRRLAVICRWVPDPRPDQLERLRGEAHPDDVGILAAAISAGCGWLITFNVRDYHPRSDPIKISTPGTFIRRLREILRGI